MSQNRVDEIGRSIATVRLRREADLHVRECCHGDHDVDDETSTGGAIPQAAAAEDVRQSLPLNRALKLPLADALRLRQNHRPSANPGFRFDGCAPVPEEEMPEVASELRMLASVQSNFLQGVEEPLPAKDFSPDWERAMSRDSA